MFFGPNVIITFSIDLLVMLGMLTGHAGDVEHDADDVDGLA